MPAEYNAPFWNCERNSSSFPNKRKQRAFGPLSHGVFAVTGSAVYPDGAAVRHCRFAVDHLAAHHCHAAAGVDYYSRLAGVAAGCCLVAVRHYYRSPLAVVEAAAGRHFRLVVVAEACNRDSDYPRSAAGKVVVYRQRKDGSWSNSLHFLSSQRRREG